MLPARLTSDWLMTANGQDYESNQVKIRPEVTWLIPLFVPSLDMTIAPSDEETFQASEGHQVPYSSPIVPAKPTSLVY